MRLHECFLAPARCPVGVFSKTVCGVKSHCGSRMENADMQPASFFQTPLTRAQEDSKKTSALYHHQIQGEEERFPKGFQRKQNFVLKSASCVGWKTKGTCILECTGS